MKPFVTEDLSNAEYRKMEGVSKSDLDHIHQSPLHFRSQAPHEPTPAMIIGTAAHACVLEPDRFRETYMPEPEGNRRTKAHKDACLDLTLSGATLLKAEDYDAVVAMGEAVRSNAIAARILDGAVTEASAFANVFALDSLRCKCRPDAWNESLGVMMDFKTIEDASPKSFAKQVATYRYHVQEAWYRQVWTSATGLSVNAFVFVAVEKKPPYAVALYQLDTEAVSAGWRQACEDAMTYKQCAELDDWPGYSPRIETIYLPRWAMEG